MKSDATDSVTRDSTKPHIAAHIAAAIGDLWSGT